MLYRSQPYADQMQTLKSPARRISRRKIVAAARTAIDKKEEETTDRIMAEMTTAQDGTSRHIVTMVMAGMITTAGTVGIMMADGAVAHDHLAMVAIAKTRTAGVAPARMDDRGRRPNLTSLEGMVPTCLTYRLSFKRM